jgi:hypothetical protein
VFLSLYVSACAVLGLYCLVSAVGRGFLAWLCAGFVLSCVGVFCLLVPVLLCFSSVSFCNIIVLQRGTRDTPNSMGAERQRAEAKHKQTQSQDKLTRDRSQTHPHKSAKATGKLATVDNLRPPRPTFVIL